MGIDEEEDDNDDNALSKIANAGLRLCLSTYGAKEMVNDQIETGRL